MNFTYHEVLRADSPFVYSVTCEQFSRHVALLRQNDRKPACSFDDGHVSQYECALPLLSEQNYSSIFFVTAGWIGNKRGYMTWEQLRELAALGHQVQSHSWSHQHLGTCSGAALESELRLSKLTLEDKLGHRVDSISAPGGRWNPRVAAACAAAGYTRLYISNAWYHSTVHGVEVIGRYMVRRTTRASDLADLIRTENCWISAPRLRYQMTGVLRRTLGEHLYHKLWRHFGSAPALPGHERA